MRCSMEVLIMEMVSTSNTSLEQFLTTKLVLDSQWYKAQAHILLYRNDHQDNILQPWALSFQPWGDRKFELGRCGKAGSRTFDIVVSSTAVCLLWHKLRCRNQRDHQEVLTFQNGKEHDRKQSISMCSVSVMISDTVSSLFIYLWHHFLSSVLAHLSWLWYHYNVIMTSVHSWFLL